MSKFRVNSFSISIDGYGAGPNQSLENPLGSGEHLFANLDTPALGYQCTRHVATTGAMHCVLTKRS